MENTIKNIIKAITEAENILIVPHVNPDGDCIGSAVALTLLLQKEFNKKAEMFIHSKVPQIYEFLPQADNFKTYDELKDTNFDLVIAEDCAAKDRMVNALHFFEKAKVTVNFDHHKTNPAYANFNYIKPEMSSTGEVLFDFAKKAKWKLNKEIAEGLYTAILTDTGGFRFENTKAETFRAVADLTEQNIDIVQIFKNCYESKPVQMVKLSADVISKAQFLFDGKVAYTIITNDDMKKNDALNEHTDGIAEALRKINTVDIAFVVKETEDGFSKISLRSKSADVSKIALKFNGGGHSKAAGCTIKKNYSIALNKIIEAIKEETDFAE